MMLVIYSAGIMFRPAPRNNSQIGSMHDSTADCRTLRWRAIA